MSKQVMSKQSMQSERSQILSLLAGRQIDAAEAERLLIVVAGQDRFLSFGLWGAIVMAATSTNFAHGHLGEHIHAVLYSALQSLQALTGSEAFRHLHLFIYRFLGELP